MSKFADLIIATTGANIEIGGNRVFYERPFPRFNYPFHLSGDKIYMLPKWRFADENEYYFTLFHELSHWAEIRVGWSGSNEESEQIANEVATYFCNLLNIPVSGMEPVEYSPPAQKIYQFLMSFSIQYLKVEQ